MDAIYKMLGITPEDLTDLTDEEKVDLISQKIQVLIDAISKMLGITPEALMDLTDEEKSDLISQKIQELIDAVNADTADSADNAAAPTAAKAAHADPTKFVPVGEFVSLREKFDAMIAAKKEQDKQTFVNNGMTEGKIVASTVAAWSALYDTDPAKAAKSLSDAQVIADSLRVSGGAAPANTRGAIIAKSAREYRSDPAIQEVTRIETAVNLSLRDAKMTPLTEAEAVSL